MSIHPAAAGVETKMGTVASRPELSAAVVPRAAIQKPTVDAMYRLYARHYLDTTRPLFDSDLAAKTHVLVLTDDAGRLCGFSTLQVYQSAAAGDPVRVLYSGDTIVDPQHWGSSALALAWLRFAGATYRLDPGVPLYWLLIVKGHRTYRFLPTFARDYQPHHDRPPTDRQRALLNALAAQKFGEAFEPHSGIVRFASPRGRLNADLAEIDAPHLRLPAVAYFLQRNPGYRDGDELVCLCELAPENLRPLAARVFAPDCARSQTS